MNTAKEVLGVVLAGGGSRRMGRDKAMVALGGVPLLHLVTERAGRQVGRLVLATGAAPDRFGGHGLPTVTDALPDGGPLAGILAGLAYAEAEGFGWLASFPCDTPFFPENLVSGLHDALDGGDDYAVAANADREHLAFGLWPVGGRARLQRAFDGGMRRIRDAETVLRKHVVSFPDAAIGPADDAFFNINSAADLAVASAWLNARKEPVTNGRPVFGVVGWKNSGKTTLVEALVAEFTRRGRRVSTVKHAHHECEIDTPGKDSFRHREAGAHEVIVASSRRWALMHELRGDREPDLAELIGHLAPCELVLAEGFKHGPHRKIEVVRHLRPEGRIADSDGTICAVATDRAELAGNHPVLDLNDAGAIADFITAQCNLDKAGNIR